jgi:hypothetical protein
MTEGSVPSIWGNAMQKLLPHQIANQSLVMHDEMVSEIHDNLLDDNNQDLAHAFNQACSTIAELYKEIERLEKGVSAGYVRKK